MRARVQPRDELLGQLDLPGIVVLSISTSTWKLPSPTWPTIGAIRPISAMSASVSAMHSASREIGTQTSVDSPREPGRSVSDAQ